MRSDAFADEDEDGEDEDNEDEDDDDDGDEGKAVGRPRSIWSRSLYGGWAALRRVSCADSRQHPSRPPNSTSTPLHHPHLPFRPKTLSPARGLAHVASFLFP